MLKYQLKSGKILELNLAPIDTALALYRTVMAECIGAKVNLNITEEMTLSDLLLNNIEALLKVFSSAAAMEAVKSCCDKVLYDRQKFSMEIFEDEKSRSDFFSVMVIVALENLLPFFPNLRTVSEPILSQFLK